MTDAIRPTSLSGQQIPLLNQPEPPRLEGADRIKLRETFRQFTAGTFYRQMFKALRASTGRAAYFHGGQTEKIFQAQLDELLMERMANANGAALSDEFFEQQFRHGTESLRPEPQNPPEAGPQSTFQADM